MKEINNVIFEKDVLKKLCDDLKNFNQIFILTSPTPKQTYLPILSNMLKERGIIFWCYCLPKNARSTNENVLKACSNVKGATAILSLGAGTVCDISKIVAKKNGPFVLHCSNNNNPFWSFQQCCNSSRKFAKIC